VSCLNGINNLIANVLHNDKTYRKYLFIIVILSGITYLLMNTLTLLDIVPLMVRPGTLRIANDFQIYMESARAFLNGEDPYQYGFMYFPLSILFYVPFTQLHFNYALLLIGLINFLLLIITTIFAIKILHYYDVSLPKCEKILLFFAIFLFYPVTASATFGQANTIILCSLTVFYYYLITTKNSNLRPSLSLWAATILKVFPLALIYIAILRRKWKFTIIYLSMLSASCIASVLLLGIPIHIRYIETFFGFQNFETPYNASLSAIFFGLLEFLNVSESVQNTLGIAWLIVRIIFVVLILSYLYVLKVKKDCPSENWEILTFSLILALVIAMPDNSWFYYAMFLVPSYILYIFVLRLNGFEKSVVAISLIFFSFPMHATYISKIIGGALASLIYTTGLGVYGSLLFLSLTVYKIVRIKRSVEVIK